MSLRLGGWWRLWIVGAVIYGAGVIVAQWHDLTISVSGIAYERHHIEKLSDRSLEILAGKTQLVLWMILWMRQVIHALTLTGKRSDSRINCDSDLAESLAIIGLKPPLLYLKNLYFLKHLYLPTPSCGNPPKAGFPHQAWLINKKVKR